MVMAKTRANTIGHGCRTDGIVRAAANEVNLTHKVCGLL